MQLREFQGTRPAPSSPNPGRPSEQTKFPMTREEMEKDFQNLFVELQESAGTIVVSIRRGKMDPGTGGYDIRVYPNHLLNFIPYFSFENRIKRAQVIQEKRILRMKATRDKINFTINKLTSEE